MDVEEYGFKDKEIERVTSDLTKANRREFGRTFKSAAENVGEGALEYQPDSAEPIKNPAAPDVSNLSITPADATSPAVSTPGVSGILDAAATQDESKKELYRIARPLRTYERDIAEAIRSKNESVASINIAAQEKRQEKRIEKNEPAPIHTEQVAQKSIVFLISLIMIFASVSIIAIAYYMFANHEKSVTPATPSIIATNEKTELDITGQTGPQILEKIKVAGGQSIKQNDLLEIELSEKTDKGTVKILPQRFFELTAKNAPASLDRALGQDWVLGFHNIGTNEPFIFASVASFGNVVDGMLRWEKDMAENLEPLFGGVGSEALSASQIISTSTPVVVAPSKFVDLIIKNKDVRALKNSSGKIVLLYSFLDPKNLVITTNEQTFREILNRFFSSQLR